MVVDLSPGSGGVLANCVESRDAYNNAPVEGRRSMQRSAIATGGQPKSIFTLEWGSVDRVMALSESVLVLSVLVTMEGERADIDSTTQALQEILVAPCPARMLQLGIAERKNAIPIRKEMQTFVRRW